MPNSPAPRMAAAHAVPEALFCYGTLQFSEVMQVLAGRVFPAGPATLPGYACFQVHGEVFPGIVPAKAAQTSGILYQGLDPGTLAILDAYEGDYYERRPVAVTDAAQTPHRAWTYVIRPQLRHRLSRKAWDKERFCRRELKSYLRRLGR